MNFNSSKPFCFLDIDGVLNSVKWAKSPLFKELRKQYLAAESRPGREDRNDQIDPEAVECLNDIADWNFILSSSWRHFVTLEQINKLLQNTGFKGEIKDKTPDFRSFPGALRGNEIYYYLENNIITCDSNFSRYIIFDDDSDMLLWQAENFIHVDNHFGLGPNHVWRAKRLMEKYK